MSKNIRSYVPRALYYMNFWTPFRSLSRLFFRPSSLRQGTLTQNLRTELESRFGGHIEFVPHARIGLYFILKYLNLDPGSEVIMTPINLPEMLKMIRIQGLSVQFAGYKPHSFEIDYDRVQITPRSKVFLYTPIAGIHADLDQLKEFCDKNGLVLIQDLTQSFLGKWKNSPIHDFAAYNFLSFCDLKVVHTHRGGMIQTQDRKFRNWFRAQEEQWLLAPDRKYFFSFIFEDLISNTILRRGIFQILGRLILTITSWFGKQTLEDLTAGRGIRVGRFHLLKDFMASGNDWALDEIPVEQRYRYTDLQAEIGLERLRKLELREKRRIEFANLFYKNLGPEAQNLIPDFPEDSGHVFWKTPLIVPDFHEFQSALRQQKVDSARSNLPWLPDLLQQNHVSGRTMRDQCVYVPTHYYLKREEILLIADAVNEYARQSMPHKTEIKFQEQAL